jgi:hypothetical protein
MSETRKLSENSSQTVAGDYYLPAVSVPPGLGRLESFVSDLTDLHGVVLIPDTYNN